MYRGSDPMGAWRYYSRRASAVLNVAAALKQDKLGDLRDWQMFAVINDGIGSSVTPPKQICDMWRVEFSIPKDLHQAVEEGRHLVALEVTNWLRYWRIERRYGLSDFSVIWNSDAGQWQVQVEYNGYLFTAIALQLFMCIAGVEALYTCTGCGFPYTRRIKRPKPGTGNYCPKCQPIAQRRAVAAHREKLAKAVRLHTAGVPMSEIAVQLKTSVARAREWCKGRDPKPLHGPTTVRPQKGKSSKGRNGRR
jgi:hypothetical protein